LLELKSLPLFLPPTARYAATAALPTTDRRRGSDRRRTLHERRQLLLKDAQADERRRGASERRSGLDRRVHALRSSARPPVPRETIVQPQRTQRLGTRIDLYV